LTGILHIPPSRIKIIENALPDCPATIPKKPTAQQRTRFRRRFNLPAKSFLIATVANLRPVKGHDVLLDAAAEALQQHKSVYFLLIGQGPQRQDICRHINRLGLDPQHIVFLGQRLDVPDLLRHCDLFVLPSYSESFGLAVLEAMAAGLPVIATDCPGPRSLIEHNRTGLLTPVAQPYPLAQAIIGLLEDSDRRDRLAAKAQLFAQQKRFHISTMTKAFENLFELLV
jgi:glycosyltransferase involved in cell wall biosynthesis